MLNKRADKLELLRIAEAVALEKSIDKELIISSMETGIAKAAKSKFGQENEINKDKTVGDEVLQPLPSFDFGRIPEDDGSFSWEKTDKTSIFSK